MKLVPDWKEAWRWHSTRAFAALAALPLVWSQLPPDVTDMLPEAYEPAVLAVLALGGLVGRMKDQG